MNDTIIKQYAKKVSKEYIDEFYEFVYTILNNLIDTNMDSNLKLVFINYLMFEKSLVFFLNHDKELQIGRVHQILTRDENLLPIDIKVRTLSGKMYNLLKEDYIKIYNPIPVNYLQMKVGEISNIEKIAIYLRKLYKIPVIFQSKDTKALASVKNFIKSIFSTDDVCTITNESFDVTKKLDKIDLKIDYITDKLLEENESLKEDILEILGIYKNTSGNRERVNETELIISNSLTTVNKLGLEKELTGTIDAVNKKFNQNITLSLNIDKIFNEMTNKKEEK